MTFKDFETENCLKLVLTCDNCHNASVGKKGSCLLPTDVILEMRAWKFQAQIHAKWHPNCPTFNQKMVQNASRGLFQEFRDNFRLLRLFWDYFGTMLGLFFYSMPLNGIWDHLETILCAHVLYVSPYSDAVWLKREDTQHFSSAI